MEFPQQIPLSWSSGRGRRLPRRHPLALRISARLHRFDLDHKLALGERCDHDPLLDCRSRQLRSKPMRRRLAAALRGAVRQAQRPVALSAAVSVSPDVQRLSAELLELADRLEAERPLRTRDLAMLNLLVTDAGSPLWAHTGSGAGELERALGPISTALRS
jgi:hypothetical protein